MKNAEINSEKSKVKYLIGIMIITIYNYLCIAICFFAEETVKVFTTREFYPSMYIIPIYVTYIF